MYFYIIVIEIQTKAPIPSSKPHVFGTTTDRKLKLDEHHVLVKKSSSPIVLMSDRKPINTDSNLFRKKSLFGSNLIGG